MALAGGIIGFGNVLEHGHLPAWLARDDVRLVAVAEPNPERRARARALLPEAVLYDDAAQLLDAQALDFVDIATPPTSHVRLIRAAAAAGTHVVCEKPLVLSPEEFRQVHDAMARAGVTLFTVHNWKHAEPFRRVRELVATGAIGPLTDVSFEVSRDGCARSVVDEWRTRREQAGGGILVDHGWHAFYLMLALVDERPRAIRAELGRRRYMTADVEDSARCMIEFASVIGRIELTWAGSERRTCWRLRGRDGEIGVVDDHVSVRRAGRVETFTCTDSLSSSSHHPEWFAGVIEAFRREITDPAARGANLAEAEQCVHLLSLAYASDAGGARSQALPPAADSLARADVLS